MGRYTGDSGLFTYPEYKNRGVIKLAPDALVFISSNLGTTVIAPIKGVTQQVDFRDGVSSISVQSVLDPPGSSTASVEIIAPIQKDNFWVSFPGENGRTVKYPYFVPMMEVKIYFRGRYLVDKEPKYYPAFWGFITNVEENFSGGLYKFNLQCADMLHWWSYVQVLFKPDIPTSQMSKLKNISIFGSRYVKSSAFDIIYSLTEDMSFENFTTPEYLVTITPDGKKIIPEKLQAQWAGIMSYWQQRFKTAGNFLRMYGARGQLINDPTDHINNPTKQYNTNHPDNKSYDTAATASNVRVDVQFSSDDRFTKDFPVYYMLNKFGMDSAEYLSKLEIATYVKDFIEYEFFQDVNGNFIFKPPFWNLNTKNILPYRIKPLDIINYSFGVNADEIVTSLEVKTGLLKIIEVGETIKNVGYHIDLDLARKFGDRHRAINIQYITESGLTQSIARGHLSKMNVKAYNGSVTIPGRPELRLGYPVYIEHKDKFHYVTSINHSFDFAGSFTTTLSLNAERGKVYDYDDKAKGWIVQKDKIYKWDGSGSITSNASTAALDQADVQGKLEDYYRGNGSVLAMTVGDYIITDRNTSKIGIDSQETAQKDSVPYTDEDGYKVIGSFRYGRGMYLTQGVNPFVELDTSITDKAAKQAQDVTSIKPSSDEEGNMMNDYFKANKSKSPPIETVIPSYLEQAPLSEADAANAVMNISLGLEQTIATLNKDKGEILTPDQKQNYEIPESPEPSIGPPEDSHLSGIFLAKQASADGAPANIDSATGSFHGKQTTVTMDPVLRQALVDAGAEYATLYSGTPGYQPMIITSGIRTDDQQNWLYVHGYATNQALGNHDGNAFDVDLSDPNTAPKIVALLKQHNLYQPVPGDPVHFQVKK